MAPLYTLAWLPEHQRYALSQPGQPDTYDIQEQWRAWLDACSSFAFEGRNGHLTLRKEPRKRGESYWYAYCTRNRRTRKRYAGRSTDLTIAKLEEIARLLTATEPAPRTAPTLTLLETKLSLPRLQTSLLSRSRLLDRFNLGLERKLTLISAPAGFGKTTIVRQWLNSRTEPVAWLSLDAGDNDPARFWRYVVAACRALLPDQGQQVLALFATPSQPPFTLPPLEAILTTFLNALAHCNAGLLVLEDYHVITDPCIHETLAFFLNHLPPTLHIVLIARGDPPLPLVRLRARNELHELHAHDLRFSPEETRAFLTQELAFTLTPETLNTLSTRLEGWPAGLRLPESGRRPLASAKGMDGAGSQQQQDVPLRLTEDNRCVRIREDSEDEQGARDADLRRQARWVESAIRRHRGSHPHHPVHSQHVPAPLDGCTWRLQE
ncbi:hypothetical protein [Thermosporothrix hazakensis]|uniref:hypothetical protein n=1 Tax=Thermosporothrix hazakensis TaxID=644383 RepID=UPI001FE991FA|nr:hypothetical protein [Thermosporothrix hazakensis]